MAFTSGGLVNNRQTAHYAVQYDDALPKADGQDRAKALLSKHEQDFALKQAWFAGIDLEFSCSIPVQIAGWNNPSDFQLTMSSDAPAITVEHGSRTSADFCRSLPVSEVTA